MSWWSRLGNVFRASHLERELDEELRFHLDERVRELTDAGVPPDAAAAKVARRFGSPLRWREQKAALTNTLVAIADRYVGGLASRVHFQEGATPRTMERYTRNTNGALYGWELSPRNIGPGRPATRTPLPGLHLVGHWTQPGGGVTGVVTSGVQAAREILGHARESHAWDLLWS